ncbi:triple tyrosine motif-containing protein [Reichenbachiella sp. MSK19-1]|uniref:triple tyrosine motif-containing protein n=1 Tax=Reichenbachiella sp. MSK19-1 TaxID=1897631 RepID=UPI000E6B8B65|nr:triple tyrosine motif-containing protein [Reichenbachiella sp. MSK19-1]RJE70628.1 hypothetical protein BGP76_11115 [Reichenbachiella sp. MSK19-1]
MLRYICLTALLCISLTSQGQQGDLFLTHHSLSIEGMDNLNFDITSNSKGQLCIANRSGILFYDGDQWDYVSTPSSALSVTFDKDDNLYVGCVGDFGKIDHLDNQYQFISLNPNENDHGLYNKTLYKDSSIYFMSENNIIRYHTVQKRANLLYLDDKNDYFTNMFEVYDEILVQTSDTLYQFKNDSLSSYNWNPPSDAKFLFFDKHPTEDKYVAGTTDNRTFIYRKPNFYECKISEFLEEHESFVNDGKWVNDRYFALSTLEDGCILYDNKKSEIKEIINQSKGLPDNQIYTIGADQEEGLWISHAYGLSRMEISIPFRSFSNFQGLHGNISEVYFHNRTLYAATSEGVYFLDKEDVYKNTVYYEEKKSKQSAKTNKVKKEEPDQKQEKKGWWIFGRNKEEEKDEKYTNPQHIRKADKKQYVKRIHKEFLHSKFLFKPVEGIHSKIEKFIIYKGKLLAAGTNGVYEIKDGSGELVIHEPVRLIEKERKTNRLIIVTYFNEIKLYELDDEIWVIADEIDLHGNLILNTLNDVSGRTWFITAGALYEFNMLSSNTQDFNVYVFNNPFVDKAKLAYIDKQLYLINNQGYFYLNTTLKKIVEDTTLLKEIGPPLKHLQQRNEIVWVYNGENWYQIHADKRLEMQENFRLFPNMNYVSEYGGRLWLLNESTEILQYEPALADTLIANSKMFFRRVTNNNGDVKIQNNMSFTHEENSLHFEMSRPDYRGLLKAEYQYRLKGLNNEWSNWRENNRIDFNLQPGSYALKVKSRDSFGNVQESEEINFVIHPPYWQTLWFYGLQILLMVMLLVGSIILNRRAKSKNVLLTEALTIITIVMVIEFLQSAAGNYLSIQSSPVVDFGLDVAIALCVFPLEQFLKKYLKAEKEGKGLEGMGIIDILTLPFKKKKKEAVST